MRLKSSAPEVTAVASVIFALLASFTFALCDADVAFIAGMMRLLAAVTRNPDCACGTMGFLGDVLRRATEAGVMGAHGSPSPREAFTQLGRVREQRESPFLATRRMLAKEVIYSVFDL